MSGRSGMLKPVLLYRRDLYPSIPHDDKYAAAVNQGAFNNWGNSGINSSPITVDDSSLTSQPGVAGWNDRSAMADACALSGCAKQRASLFRKPVLWCVVSAVFVGAGAAELDYFSQSGTRGVGVDRMPIIALGGMAAVVKMAQLDIGFARGANRTGGAGVAERIFCAAI